MFSYKVLVFLAMLVHCILSMPTSESAKTAEVDQQAEEYRVPGYGYGYGYRGYGYGGYHRPYYGGYGGYGYRPYGGYYGGYW